MILIVPFIISMLNILTNHTMLIRKRSVLFCITAFILNSMLVLVVASYLRMHVTDPMIYKYVFYGVFFWYFGYIYFVFSDTLPIKLFSMLSVGVFSTIIVALSNMLYNFIEVEKVNLLPIQSIRMTLQLLLLWVSYSLYGKYFKKVLVKISDNVIYLMSGYMFIALLMLINNFSWNGQLLTNGVSMVEMSLLIVFIILGYLIVFFGISSFSKNISLKQRVSRLKEQSDIYYNLASYDDLTGIASRQNIINQISETLTKCQSSKDLFAVLMFDIDKFKAINDQYGHTIGDTALKYVADRVDGCLREGDLIGRLGGDEFLICPKSIHTLGDVQVLIKRIIEVFEGPLVIGELRIPIDISIGVSIYPTNARQVEDLLNQSDQAMYMAKKEIGTTYSIYKGSHNNQMLDKLQIVEE